MAWNFETDPEFQEQLDWIEDFVHTEVEPIDLLIKNPWDLADPVRQALLPRCRRRYGSESSGRATWDLTWVEPGTDS